MLVKDMSHRRTRLLQRTESFAFRPMSSETIGPTATTCNAEPFAFALVCCVVACYSDRETYRDRELPVMLMIQTAEQTC